VEDDLECELVGVVPTGDRKHAAGARQPRAHALVRDVSAHVRPRQASPGRGSTAPPGEWDRRRLGGQVGVVGSREREEKKVGPTVWRGGWRASRNGG
jgi:hypothetical protein